MKFLIKIFCLLSLLSSFSFSKEVSVLSKEATKSMKPFVSEIGFLNGQEYLFRRSSKSDYAYLERVDKLEPYYILDRSLTPGFYIVESDDFFVDGVYNTGKFSPFQHIGYTVFSDFGSGEVHNYTLAYRIRTYSFLSCKYSENFGIKSQKCFPACPAGQSWDIENEVCYSDCSDKDLNKFGYPNGTAQGGCVDCSNALSDDQIMRCVCSGFGSTYDPGVLLSDHDNPDFVMGSCKSGRQIYFKKRDDKKIDKDKNKDNNSTNSSDKDKDNPKPDKDKDKDNKNDNNSTNSSNKDNKKEDTKPDKKDNNENSNNSSGESGNSSNNNSGGSSGNGSSGGGGTGVETKPNPNYNGNGKENGKGDGKEDGKGEEGRGDDAEAQKLDFGDLEKDAGKFEGEFKKAVDDSFSFVNDVKASLMDTLQKIKDGNLMSLNKGSISSTCPLNYRINLIYFEKDVTFDICKSISPASQTLYYFFYVAFFVLFLVLIIKLFLFTFMGW